jgi:hypothetical protein
MAGATEDPRAVELIREYAGTLEHTTQVAQAHSA